MVDGANNQDNTETAGKLQKQQEAILKVIEANKYEPMRIPDGKKRELSRRIVRISTQTCLKVQHLLTGLGSWELTAGYGKWNTTKAMRDENEQFKFISRP